MFHCNQTSLNGYSVCYGRGFIYAMYEEVNHGTTNHENLAFILSWFLSQKPLAHIQANILCFITKHMKGGKAVATGIAMTHKIRLRPNKYQEKYLEQSAGTARFAYNWALSEWKKEYPLYKEEQEYKKAGGFGPYVYQYALNGNLFDKRLNAIKKDQFPWMYEVPPQCIQQAIRNLDTAFKRSFKKIAGFPKYKKKGRHDSFYLSNNAFSVSGNRIKVSVPRKSTTIDRDNRHNEIKMCELFRGSGRILSATFSKQADKWYVAITYELSSVPKIPVKSHDWIGVDLGISDFAVLSDGTKHKGPHSYRKAEKKLLKLNRSHSRKQKGSRNREKARIKLARAHVRIVNIRKDFQHKLSTFLTREYENIVVETLNISGMKKNRCLAKHIADASWYSFVSMLEYKAKLTNTKLHKAPKFYASSQICSGCGNLNAKVKDLKIREWTCNSCNMVHDRDVNAARNLVFWAKNPTKFDKSGRAVGSSIPNGKTPVETCKTKKALARRAMSKSLNRKEAGR